jgi:hypothetical protein
VGGPDYDRLFGLHGLEHKTCGDPARASFDGLGCDGSANYLKLLREGDGWKVADFKARSFKKEAKDVLAPWIVKTYSEDRYAGPPPITESTSLLTYKDAGRFARKALHALEEERPEGEQKNDPLKVYVPLGLDQRRIQSYKVIKPSAFVFRTPQQRERFEKAVQKFAGTTGCGLEALALRRGRRKGLIEAVAEAIYRLIREGEEDFTKALNLTRPFQELEHIRQTHYQQILRRKAEAVKDLNHMIDARTMAEPATRTGLFVTRADIVRFP